MTWAELGQLGQLLGGVGILLTSICAAATLIRISLQQHRKQWFDDYCTLFTEFWNNKDISEARMWIESDKLYNDILKPVMMKRIENDAENDLDEEESIKQNKVDK